MSAPTGWAPSISDAQIAEIDRIAASARSLVEVSYLRGYLIALVLLHQVPRGIEG